MVLMSKPPPGYVGLDADGGAQPVRSASDARSGFPDLAKVGAPIPIAIPPIKPPSSPGPNQSPTVYPGGRVKWSKPQPPSLDDARAGKRADISNLFDVSSLHEGELQRVSQLMSRQSLGHSMKSPPKAAPNIAPHVLQLAGLDLPYDQREQAAALHSPQPGAYSPDKMRSRKGSSFGGGGGGGGGARGMHASHEDPSAGAPSDAYGAADAYSYAMQHQRSGLTSSGSAHALVSSRHAPKPSSRADVVQLEAVLRRRLAESSDALGEQIRAWDDSFGEVVRQVRLHCTERGAFLDEIRSRYNDWVSRLVLAVSELHGAKERRSALMQEEAMTQEDRLQELLLANQSLQHKMSVLRRELDWNKKAASIKSDYESGKAWKGVKNLLGAASVFGTSGGGGGGGGDGDDLPVDDNSKKLDMLTGMMKDIADELTPSQIAALLRVGLEGSGKSSGQSADERRDEVLAAIVEYLPMEAQQAMTADMISSFSKEGLAEVVDRVAEDGEGVVSLTTLQQLSLDHINSSADPELLRQAKLEWLVMGDSSPRERKLTIEAMLNALSAPERAEILQGYAADGASAPLSPAQQAKNAADAAKKRAAILAEESETESRDPSAVPHRPPPVAAPQGDAPPPLKKGNSISNRRAMRKARSQGVSPAPGSASPTSGPSSPTMELEPPEDEELQHSVGGAATMAEMLRKKHIISKELTRAEVYSLIGGAIAMKMETDAAARLSERPRLHMRDELWRYLCSRTAVRSEALQMLHNLAAALEVLGGGANAAAPTRITAFRHLTGIATPAGGCWPSVQSDFYILAVQAIFPQWATASRESYTAALGKEDLVVPVGSAIDAIKYLVKDGVLQHRLQARVQGAAADALLNSSAKVDGVGFDWFMQVLLQAWEDSQLASQKSLQTIFFEADDNGDGILQLDEFYTMIRERKPDMTDAEAFKVYDEALALSELMLGYESDAILADAFTRTAIGHNLFSELAQPLKSAGDAVHEPPPRWGPSGGAGGKKGARGGRNEMADGSKQTEAMDLVARLGEKRTSAAQRRSMPSSNSSPALPGVLGGGMVPPGMNLANASLKSPKGGKLPSLR